MSIWLKSVIVVATCAMAGVGCGKQRQSSAADLQKQAEAAVQQAQDTAAAAEQAAAEAVSEAQEDAAAAAQEAADVATEAMDQAGAAVEQAEHALSPAEAPAVETQDGQPAEAEAAPAQ